MQTIVDFLYSIMMFKVFDTELYLYLMTIGFIFGGSMIGENYRYYKDKPLDDKNEENKKKNPKSYKEYRRWFMSKVYASTFLMFFLSTFLVEYFRFSRKSSIIFTAILSFFDINKTTEIIFLLIQNIFKELVKNVNSATSGSSSTSKTTEKTTNTSNTDESTNNEIIKSNENINNSEVNSK